MGATGFTTVNFGAFPGSSDTLVNITGQAAILAGSFVEAWIFPTATADHTADEHWVEGIKIVAGNIVAGTGFTIYARNDNQLNEPVISIPLIHHIQPAGTAILIKTVVPGTIVGGYGGGKGTRLYGLFTVAWVWV